MRPKAAGSFKDQLFQPVLGSLLEQRTIVFILGALAVVQIAATSLGYGFWVCPIKAVTGRPCPGCGMSAAIAALLKGDWNESLNLHAFAPLFLLAAVFVFLVTPLPDRYRHPLIEKVKLFEQRTGLVMILLLALVVYWLVRLAGFL